MNSVDVKITLKMLKEHEACQRGIRAYFGTKRASGCGKGPLVVKWNAEAYVKASVSHRKWITWLIDRRILPRWSLSFMDLSKRDLRGAQLCGAELTFADLSRADVDGANFYRADLRYSTLIGTNMHLANLRFADLDGALYPRGELPEGWVRDDAGALERA